MIAFHYIIRIARMGNGTWTFPSKNIPGRPASGSEIRQWFQKGMVSINGNVVRAVDWFDMDTLQSVVLFPKNKNRITLL